MPRPRRTRGPSSPVHRSSVAWGKASSSSRSAGVTITRSPPRPTRTARRRRVCADRGRSFILPRIMHLTAPVSPGEFLDKTTILEIKLARIPDADKRANVARELELLRAEWARSRFASADVTLHVTQLREVNEALWEIEDRIREKEAAQAFDAEFIELARAVYKTNDRRAAIKRAINAALKSDL